MKNQNGWDFYFLHYLLFFVYCKKVEYAGSIHDMIEMS